MHKEDLHGTLGALAECYDPDAEELLPQLVYARVVKINVGMHITGPEYIARGGAKSRVPHYPQSWICATTAEELRRLAQLVRTPPDMTGFNHEDDDYPPVEVVLNTRTMSMADPLGNQSQGGESSQGQAVSE